MQKRRKSVYTYEELKPGQRQYDEHELSQEIVVEARYIKAVSQQDRGNRFIEALPSARDQEESVRAYHKHIVVNQDKNIHLEKDQFSIVNELRQLRLALPFHLQLEEEFHNALVQSYRNRYELVDEDVALKVTVESKEELVHGKMLGDAACSANAGFALLGYSGCGKSSALKILLSNYPQVIMHQDSEFGRQPQIVYLAVNCIPNSNFSQLYVSIGNAIDMALGIPVPCYEKQVAAKKGLGEKAEKVRELIELFAIGIIIFDEIQLIDFKSSRENSFESLMILTNRTKVAIAVVGTEDAYEKMFVHLRTARRVGTIIQGSKYCENKKFFEVLVVNLFHYQWFEEPVQPTRAIVDCLYENTRGIIDQLIGLYIYMALDYLRAKKKVAITPSYIMKTADKHYRGMRELLTEIDNPMRDSERQKLVRKAKEELNNLVQGNSQELFTQRIQNFVSSEQFDVEVFQNNVVKNIQVVSDKYDREMILEELEKVLNVKTDAELDEMSATKKVFSLLQSRDTKKAAGRPKGTKPQNKISTEDMRGFIMEGA